MNITEQHFLVLYLLEQKGKTVNAHSFVHKDNTDVADYLEKYYATINDMVSDEEKIFVDLESIEIYSIKKEGEESE